MKKDFFERQTERLTAQRQEILEKLEKQNSELYKLVENLNEGDEVDIASDAIDRTLLNELGAQDSARLSKIDDALDRLRRGTYGVCLNCGENITQSRLEALPYAKLCIDCQTELERKQH